MQHNQTTGIFTPPPIELGRICAEYLKDRFRSELSRRSSQPIGVAMEPPPLPMMLPVTLKVELDCIANVLANAFLNRGK
jgi:hypothetical protein